MERAARGIALADGGSGREAFLRTHWPRVAAVMLDCSPAAAPLSDWAKAWSGADAQAAQAVGPECCPQLQHAGGQARWATWRGLDRRERSAAAREGYQGTGR